MFANEHRNNWYSTSTYYLAKNFSELPFGLIVPFIYFWIGYYGCSEPDMNHWSQGIINPPERFQLFLLFTIVFVLICQGQFKIQTIINCNLV